MVGLPDDLDFRGLQTLDGKTVFAMSAGTGIKSTIYRTLDSGKHWTLVHQNRIPEAFFDGVKFYNALRGLVVGDPVDGKFFLLATSDGGTTWAQLPGPAARDGEGAFAASNTSVAVTPAGDAWFGTGGLLGSRVLSSHDWGRTWSASQSTVPHEATTGGLFSVTFVDDKHGFAAGGDYKKENDGQGVLAESVDGGASWTALPGPTGFRSAIVADGHRLLVTGPSGTDLRPAPSGRWEAVPGAGFHAMSSASKGKLVWACGSQGRVGHLRLR